MTARGQEEQKCPVCNHREAPIVEHRGIRRRRECGECRHRWTTYEISAARLEFLETLEQHASAMADAIGATKEGDPS
jgi:transcriptional regulator NrdR family protein